MTKVYDGEIELDGKLYPTTIYEDEGEEAEEVRAEVVPIGIVVACAKGTFEKLFGIEFIEAPEDVAKKVCGKTTGWILDKLKAKERDSVF